MRRDSGLLLAFALIVSACTGGPGPAPPVPSLPPPPFPDRAPGRGGEIVVGAEQWPGCLNPITASASADWTHHVVLQHVLPRAMEIDLGGNYVASPLVSEAPTLDNGGLQRGPPFTVTYRISDDAVWGDGSPITSEDVAFTWRAFLNTTGAYGAEDYGLIEAIDTDVAKRVVLRFKRPFAGWPELFGGQYGYVLERAAFPDADPQRPNLWREMKRDLPFSGGPFKLKSFDDDGAVLVRNPAYFGPEPLLDRVTFVPTLDQELEFDALTSGAVSVIHPQPALPPDAAYPLLDPNPSIRVLAGPGTYTEAVWLNHSIQPLDDPAVREALMFAIDREAILDAIVRPLVADAEVMGCGFLAFPQLGGWCDTKPFERFAYDPGRARAILRADGYDCGPHSARRGAGTSIWTSRSWKRAPGELRNSG